MRRITDPIAKKAVKKGPRPTPIKSGPDQGDETMVTARTDTDYIKPNLEIYGKHLERYRESLIEGGKSKGGAMSIIGSIRAFLARCPPTNPDCMTPELMADVSARMEADGLTPFIVRQALIHTGRFIAFITDFNPFSVIDPDSKEDWFVGHMGRFLFENELDKYLEHLDSLGYAAATIRKKRIHITICCRILEKELGVASIEEIDSECCEHIGKLTSDLIPAVSKQIIFNLDGFVRYFTGISISESMKMRPDEMEDTEEWREFEELLNGYIRDQAERGLRPSSLQTITYSIKEGYGELVKEFGPVRAKDIDYHHIRHLRNSIKGLKQRTLRRYLGRLGKMLEFWFGVNPYHRADLVWSPETVERSWIFKEQWEVLWDSADVSEKLVLALGGGMGLRRAEIATIKLSDINGNRLTVYGKGHGPDGKVVVMEIPPTVRKCIDDYLAYRNSILLSNGDRSGNHLIVMDSKRCGISGTIEHVNIILQKLFEKTGIYATCHTLRRFYCMAMVDAGTDIDTVRRMMRHESARTTYENYIYADPRKLADATKTVENAIFG